MLFDENQGPFPAVYGMKSAGILKTRTSPEIKSSRISVGFETLDRHMFKAEACYQPLSDCGVKWARCQTGWSRCEKEKGRYDFAWLDEVADRLIAAGIKPWFSICYGNRLYCPDAPHESAVGAVPIYYGPEAIKAWENYVDALVRHFADRVDHWEVWNEPNGEWCWSSAKPNGTDYVRFARITSDIVRAIDPKAQIIGGVVCNFDMNFLEEALRAGLGDCCDILSFHVYSLIPEWGFANYVDAVKGMLDRYAPKMRLWQGETGCPSVAKDHHDEWLGIRRMDEEIQAKWVARRLLTDLRHDLELSSYFHTADLMESLYVMGDGKPSHPVMLGLLNGLTYTPKKAYFALRNLCAVFDEDTVRERLYIRLAMNEMWDITRTADRNLCTAIMADSYVRNGYPLYVYYSPTDLQNDNPVESVHGVEFWIEAEKTIRNPVIVDPVSGKVFHLRPGTVNGKSMTINCLPLMDYPLILTDAAAIELQTEQ